MTYLDLITPINIPEEKVKFFNSQSYSPQFIYKWDEQTIQSVLIKQPSLAPLAAALIKQNSELIKITAAEYFDVVYKPKDIQYAKQLISKLPPESNGKAEDVVELLTQKLSELGIDYKVEVVDKHGFQCRPDHKAKIIRISKYLHLQFYPVDSIVNHELVHIIRAVNGNHLGITPSIDYLPTEEGLACLVQDRFLKAPSASAFQHALEYLASYQAITGSFKDVYNFFIANGCDTNNAWLRSIRQKYGLCDTSLPGSLMKSGMYFYHEQLLKQKTTDEIIRLFVGKIPLSELHEYPVYNGIVKKDKILTLFT